jgi:hypothetical protein
MTPESIPGLPGLSLPDTLISPWLAVLEPKEPTPLPVPAPAPAAPGLPKAA